MKTIIMLRGSEESRLKSAEELLIHLNSDRDDIRAFYLTATKWITRDTKDDLKAAYSTCTHYLKKFLMNMEEPILIVDNPNIHPSTWRSYMTICAGFENNRFFGLQTDTKPSKTFEKELTFFSDAANLIAAL